MRCKNCNTKVDKSTLECPKCGCKEFKKSKKGLVISLILIILVLLAGACYYFFFMKAKEPIEVFRYLVNNSFKEVSSEKFSYEFEISNELNLPKEYTQVTEIVNGITLGGNLSFDNNIVNSSYNIKYNEDEFIDCDVIVDKDFYVYLKDHYDKYIKLDSEEVSQSTNDVNLNKEDINVVVKSLKSAINNSFKEKYFSSENEKIVYRGKEVDTIKNTISLDDNAFEVFYKDVLTNLSKDNDFVSSMAKIEDISEKEVKDQIKNNIDNYQGLDEFTIEISLYTKNNKVLGLDFDYSNTDNPFGLVVREKEKNKYLVDISSKGKDVGEATFDVEKDNIIAQVNVPSLDLDYKLDIKVKKQNDFTVKTSKDIDSVNLSDVKEEELNKIREGIMNNPGFVEIYTRINSFKGV